MKKCFLYGKAGFMDTTKHGQLRRSWKRSFLIDEVFRAAYTFLQNPRVFIISFHKIIGKSRDRDLNNLGTDHKL